MKEQITGNVKPLNKYVKYAQEYLNKHSKEVSQIDFVTSEIEEGYMKIEIIFNTRNSLPKEAQEILMEEKNDN